MSGYVYEGFEELAEAGFINEYVEIDHEASVVRPAFDLEHLTNSGFLGKGKRVKFLNHNGRDSERELALKRGLVEGQILTVKTCKVGTWSSEYSFYEVSGQFNTVMFEEVREE